MLIAAVIGAALAIGMLWTTVHFIFNRYLNTIVKNQALISATDVLAVAPYLLGVILLAVLTSTVTLWRYLRI